MNFILFLIIAIVIFGSKANEKASENSRKLERKKKQEKRHLSRSEFAKKYVDVSIEKDCMDKCVTHSQIYKRITDELKSNGINAMSYENLAFMIALAEYGKIPKEYSLNGIVIGCYDSLIFKGKDIYEKNHQFAKFIDYYNNVLKEHGVDEDLYFKRRNDTRDIKMTTSEMACIQYPLLEGSYTWNSVGYDFVECDKIDIENIKSRKHKETH